MPKSESGAAYPVVWTDEESVLCGLHALDTLAHHRPHLSKEHASALLDAIFEWKRVIPGREACVLAASGPLRMGEIGSIVSPSARITQVVVPHRVNRSLSSSMRPRHASVCGKYAYHPSRPRQHYTAVSHALLCVDVSSLESSVSATLVRAPTYITKITLGSRDWCSRA